MPARSSHAGRRAGQTQLRVLKPEADRLRSGGSLPILAPVGANYWSVRILIVEDFEPYRRFIRMSLQQRAEFQVVSRCLEQMRRNDFRLLDDLVGRPDDRLATDHQRPRTVGPDADRDQVGRGDVAIGGEREHPIIWTHASGRKSMVIGTTADRILGMEIPAGRAMLVRLQEWAAQPAYSLRHKWSEGDFVIWDNTGAMHRAIPYDKSTGRMMHRTSIAGTEAVAA